MSPAEPPRQVEVFPNGEVGVVWSDGREDFFEPRRLRLACPCAQCVDEISGRRLLQPAAVPETVRAVEITPVGRYALAIRWSDGHQTGIYSFEYLRALTGEGAG